MGGAREVHCACQHQIAFSHKLPKNIAMVEIAVCINYLLIIYISEIAFIYEINLIFFC